MRATCLLLAPGWWKLKNSIVRFHGITYLKIASFFLLTTGFWYGALRLLNLALVRLQGMSTEVGTLVILKGLALVLTTVFFLLIFSGLVQSIRLFYLSKELSTVLSFPVHWDSVYFSKWVETFVSSGWMVLFFGTPLFLACGMALKVPLAYYFIFPPVLVLFTGTAVATGILLAISLMSVLPARQTKNFLVFMGLLIFVVLYLLLRFVRPERFANPEWFANLTIFLAEIKMPVFVFLPSMWTVEVLSPFFRTGEGTPFFYAALLIFTSASLVALGHELFRLLFYNGWVKAQEGHKAFLSSQVLDAGDRKPGRSSLRGLYPLFLRFTGSLHGGRGRALSEKDLTIFLRDFSQWSHSRLLLALVLVYIFSIKALPVDWGTFFSVKLRYGISFLNIGLVGIIAAAVSSRLVFPLVNNEGQAFWIIRSAPITIRSFLWNKYICAFVPLFLLSQCLIVISNLFLRVDAGFMVLGVVTDTVLIASITGLAVGMGASSSDFSTGSRGRSQSGFAETLYMLIAFGVVSLTIALEAIPTIFLFIGQVSKIHLKSLASAVMGMYFFAALALNAFVLFFSLRRGQRKLESLE